MKKVEMPKMGDTMEEGKILHWLKNVGDTVKKGDMLAEVETDKVNIEIEAFSSGVLRKILTAEGESAPIGAAIALIGTPEEALPGENGSSSSSAKTAVMPIGEGKNTRIEAVQQSSGTVATQVTPASTTNNGGRIFISPLARRFAEEHQLDYAVLQGTGPNGRIIKMDVEAALAQLAQLRSTAPTPALLQQQSVAPEQQPVFAFEPQLAAVETEDVVEIPLTSMRRTIARRLSQSMQTSPHFYVTTVIDTTKLAALRKQVNEYAVNDPIPVKVSFNDLIVRAVARALVRMPQVNVSFAEDKLLQKKTVNIGVAVALEQGLIVPVLKNADQRGILDIARETRRLAEAARDGKLRPEEFSGGTFTVSNLGMFEVESFTAVINPPESAILAVGSITPTPVVVDGQVVVRDRMKVTLSSDHRAIDGALAAHFLQEIKRLLEEPFGLLL
ncbi:MAG TPA: dihydrolipoamide acetyltransferase family protein [Ktedonobacteraceae bacterium]|nr:dihydrolipoamide acetyltransferase family protein [Ktedonobacteraceae bacterium]